MRNAIPGKFGDHLRWWRRRRGLSQLELAGVARTSQRHLSFLESGRAAPSQQMVLSLAAALNVSLRQQNAFLALGRLRAGLARGRGWASRSSPRWTTRSPISWPSRSPIPAFVVDRHWNLQRANQRRGPPGRVPARSGARRPRQSGRRPPVACRPAAVRRELGGGRAPLHPRRAGRGDRRWLIRIGRRCWPASSPMKACSSCRAPPPWRRHHGPCCRSTCAKRRIRCSSSRPSRPSARRRTSRSKKSGSRASFRSSRRPHGSSASRRSARRVRPPFAAGHGIAPASVLGTPPPTIPRPTG